MITIKAIKSFKKWFAKLRDKKLRTIILERFDRIRLGDFGDCKSIKGISNLYELRIHYQSGCRIYYTWDGVDIIVMICGGSKGVQKLDIERAKNILVKGVEIYEFEKI